ncbi:MAG: hypothetical protein ACRYGR_03100 [Janthinobacterium lividum]
MVIPYGKSQDGETYVLFAHEIARAGWTPPGGKREASHKTILDTAASELYEETAAFPSFDPTYIKSLLMKQDASCVFNLKSSNTDMFALNIGDKIDQCNDIGVNYKQRIAGKPRCFNEMDQWKRVNVKDLYRILNAHQQPINNRLNIPNIGNVRGYVFNGLWHFYQAGLKQVIDASIAKPNIVVVAPAPAPVIPASTPLTKFGNVQPMVVITVVNKPTASTSFTGFGNFFIGFGNQQTTVVTKPATSTSFTRFGNFFAGFGNQQTTVVTKPATSTPFIGFGNFFAGFGNHQAPLSTNSGLILTQQNNIFHNFFKLWHK